MAPVLRNTTTVLVIENPILESRAGRSWFSQVRVEIYGWPGFLDPIQDLSMLETLATTCLT